MKKQEKTRTTRQPLLFYLDIIEQQTHKHIGHLENISKEGLMIITDKAIPLNNIKAISIQLPDFEEFDESSIDIQVEIRWMKQDINPNLYCIGCRFVKIKPKDLALIEQVREVLGFYESQSY